MTAQEAIQLLHKFDKMLDCTNTPEDLAKAVGFDRRSPSLLSVSLVAAYGTDDTKFVFEFSTHIACEASEEEWLNPDHPVIMKYFNEMKEHSHDNNN